MEPFEYSDEYRAIATNMISKTRALLEQITSIQKLLMGDVAMPQPSKKMKKEMPYVIESPLRQPRARKFDLKADFEDDGFA